MLLCEAGGEHPHDFEDLAVFAAQLGALGVEARIDVRSVPPGINRNLQFDLAPRLFDGTPSAGDNVVVIGAERLTDRRLAALRRLATRGGPRCLAIGAFADAQALVRARSKLSFVFDHEPALLNISGNPLWGEENGARPVFGVAREPGVAAVPRVLLLAPDLEDAGEARALIGLTLSRRLRFAVLTDGKAKEAWIGAHGTDVPVFHYGEALPAGLAERFEVCAVFAPPPLGYRARCLIANLAVSGAALIDGAAGRKLSLLADAFIPGPLDLAGLGAFLEAEILPNLARIGEHVRASRAARLCAPDALQRFLGVGAPSPTRSRPRRAPRPRVVVMPTNGIGLGHAQRCSLIAAELARARTETVFAAFPSCMQLVRSYGFDVMPLISRSKLHAQTHENDLANYSRLSTLAAGAAALVFDGGYVFDSVFRTLIEHRVRGVWIRRGLWQAGQNNAVALERAKAFERIVVPCEVFEELNTAYSRGENVREIAPIVQRVGLDAADRAALRDRLAERFGLGFERLVISLLGGGVAADRSAQTHALCGIMERRSDVLHLVVAWPTAALQPSWFAWERTRVVRTHHAAALVAAADLCVSAAGYNSFHEILYSGVAAIFVPQMEPRMDDQRTRALAASGRGLAATVEAGSLMTLDREITRMLDGGGAEAARSRIAALDLPSPGNALAARVIEEVAHGCEFVERGARAHSRSRRG